jgi:hypothetical protein
MRFQIGWIERREVMEIKQSRMLCLLIGLYTLISCRLYQNRNREEQQSSSSDRMYMMQRQQQQQWNYDSLSRYSLFWSDSSFRFHPDSGLIGEQGQLVMLESNVNTGIKNGLSSQISESSVQTELKSSTEKRSTWAIPNLWLITLIGATILLLGWKFGKFFKTFLP